MMREVIRRRYSGTLAADLPAAPKGGTAGTTQAGLPPPQLILVDGGKGQLAAACEELAALALTIPAMGLAKRFEHIFLPGSQQPVVLLPTSPVLHLVQHIRDEAHRFAVTYHRRLRARPISHSILDTVRGIGPKKKAALLKYFGSAARLQQAAVSDIARAANITQQQAGELVEQLRRSDEDVAGT
jgi:excinuclease ABC subunit C